MCVCVYVNKCGLRSDFSLWAAMTFALPGVEEHEADSDRLCEQLSHFTPGHGLCGWFVKAWLYVMFCLPLSHPLASSTLPFSLLFSWPNDCRSHIPSDPLCFMLPQPTVYLYLFPSLCTSLLFFFWSPRGGQVGLADDWQWISVVFVNVLMYSSMARTLRA